MLMKTRSVDFHHVEEHQRHIHDRLLNWARYVTPTSPVNISPMFKQAKSNAWQWHQPTIRETIDVIDAMQLEKLVCKLPMKNRIAIKWAYVIKCVPGHARKATGTNDAGLFKLLRDARQMLINMAGC